MASQLFQNYLFTDAGAAIVGATVDLLDRNTTTPVRATTTTDANGLWSISHATEGRFDVRITNGSSVRWHKYDTQSQIDTLEVANFRIRNPADTFDYDIVPGAITADRILNLPVITGTDTLATLGLAATFSAAQTFSGGVIFTTTQVEVADDILFTLGNDNDGVLLNRSTILATNTALTGVMVGTPVTPAIAANSIVVSNVTASGDYILALNVGGNSQAWQWVDSSAGTQTFYAAGVARILLNSTGGSFTGTWSDLGTITTADINGGTIDGATIGATATASIIGTTIDATTDFTIGTTVITDDTIVMGAIANVVNTASTTVNFAGAATTLAIGAAASDTTWTGQSFSFTGANSTDTTALTVTNSSNAAAASHSIVDVAVGGTTSTGDPQYRLTVPGGTSWYIAPDNSSSDRLFIGTATTVGSNYFVGLDPRTTTATLMAVSVGGGLPTITLASAANATFGAFAVDGQIMNYTGTTQVTSLEEWAYVIGPTLVGDTATLTVDKATSLRITAPIESTNILLVDASAIRILNTTGTPTNQYGIFIESLTAGGTDYAIWMDGTPIIHAALPAAAAATAVSLDASNNLQQNTSSVIFKDDIQPLLDSSVIYRLDPRRFVWNERTQSAGYRDVGLVAQEVARIDPSLVTWQNNEPWSIRWEPLQVHMLHEIQKHESWIATTEDRLAAVEEANRILRDQLVTAGIIPNI